MSMKIFDQMIRDHVSKKNQWTSTRKIINSIFFALGSFELENAYVFPGEQLRPLIRSQRKFTRIFGRKQVEITYDKKSVE